MGATVFTFDRLAYIDRLREAGIDEKHARAQAEALDAVATKTDMEFLREKLANIRTDFARLKGDLARWLLGTVLAIAGVVFAVEKLSR